MATLDTLLPPLRQHDAFEAKCVEVLTEFVASQPAFSVGLDGFAWFGNRTLFVHVSEAAAVKNFHAALTAWLARHLPEVPRETRPFTPHLTLATRDLPTAQVPELRRLFAPRAYQADFVVDTITLFRHDGRQWQPRATFALAERSAESGG